LTQVASRWASPLLVALLVVVWEAVAAAMLAADVAQATSKLPALHVIVAAAVDRAPLLGASLWVTARGALIGLFFGTLLGVAVALVMAQSKWLERAAYPFIVGGQMIPTIALAPIILTALRNPAATRVVVATYISFFAISLGMLKGLQSTTHEALDLMRSYNAGRTQVYRKVRLPAALPFFFAGLKVAAPLAVVGEIVVELTGETTGLGYLILVTQYYGPTYAPLFWASMMVTLLLGLAFYLGAARLERLVSPWQQEFR
jgi:NitT/TauT family transport system permease protein